MFMTKQVLYQRDKSFILKKSTLSGAFFIQKIAVIAVFSVKIITRGNEYNERKDLYTD